MSSTQLLLFRILGAFMSVWTAIAEECSIQDSGAPNRLAHAGGELSSSSTPASMYDWRVEALRTWIEQQEQSGATINMDLLSKAGHLDNFHYLGNDSNDDILTFFQRTQGNSSRIMHLIEVGSGIGGPARYIAWKGNKSVSILGADIQDDLVAEAVRVAVKVGLDPSVLKFVSGDATAEAFAFPLPDETGARKYDGFYSVLVFLHIRRESRLALFRKLVQEALDKDKGRFIIEDYVALGDFPAEELDMLERVVGAVYIPTIDQYRRDLEDAGFTDIYFEDLTEIWTDFVLKRQERFDNNYESFRQQMGDRNAENMREFFHTVATVFRGGRLGGVRITGRVAGSDGPLFASANSIVKDAAAATGTALSWLETGRRAISRSSRSQTVGRLAGLDGGGLK